LDKLWEEATADRKRLIIGSIFPEKLIFDGFDFQTARLNEGAALVYTLNKGLAQNKKGQKTDISALSNSVTLFGFFSNRVYEDLETLFCLNKMINKMIQYLSC
jgi:hypothetical protein